MKAISVDEYQICKDKNGLTFSIESKVLADVDWDTFEAVYHLERKVIVFFHDYALHIKGVPEEWMSLMPFCSEITLQEKNNPDSARQLEVSHKPLFPFN